LWVWFIFLAARELRNEWRRRFRIAVWTAAMVTCALTLCSGLAWFDQLTTRSAVIVVPEAVVRYGPLEESQSAFQLRDGAEVVVLDEKGDWLEVRDSARREGWLRRGQVMLLSSAVRTTSAVSSNRSSKI
jgi:SH3-like domain-containing protein